MTPARIPAVNPVIIFQAVIDEAVLVNPATGDSVVLNHTGILVWQQIDGRRTIDDLAAAIAAYFDISPDHVEGDVVALLDTLAVQGFIRYETGPATDASAP